MRTVPAALLVAALSGCVGGNQFATANALVTDATVIRKPQGDVDGVALALVSPVQSDRTTSQERAGAAEKTSSTEPGTIVVELHRLAELYAGGQIDASDKSLVFRQTMPVTLPKPDDPAFQSYLGIPNVTPTLLRVGFTQQHLAPASYVFVVRTRNDLWRSNPIEIHSNEASRNRRDLVGAASSSQTQTVVGPSTEKSKAATVSRKSSTSGTVPEAR